MSNKRLQQMRRGNVSISRWSRAAENNQLGCECENLGIDDEFDMDNSIPGYCELSDWPVPVKAPFQIMLIVILRCGGPRGGVYFYLKDANRHKIPFFFDEFLGRLCIGAEHHWEDDVAYIKSNSKLEREAFAAIESALKKCKPGYYFSEGELPILRRHLEHAKAYTGSSSIILKI